MKILFLGLRNSELTEFLTSGGDEVVITQDKLTSQSGIIQGVDFLISYRYRYILKKEILEKFPNKAINIHISLLPWNRGADPNLWSFLEDTPKGVSIHYMDCGIDTGDILVQQKVEFSLEETLRTSYEKLSQVAIDLFKQSWLDIRERRITPTSQPEIGSHHRSKDRILYEHLLTKGWDTPVAELIGKALTAN